MEKKKKKKKKKKKEEKKLETAQYNAAELIQSRQFVAAPMHRTTAREKKVVNTDNVLKP